MLHVDAPPAGLAETSTLPESSPATHTVVAGAHEMESRAAAESTAAVVQPELGGFPAVVEVSTLPMSSTATHSEVDWHRDRVDRRLGIDVGARPGARAAGGVGENVAAAVDGHAHVTRCTTRR